MLLNYRDRGNGCFQHCIWPYYTILKLADHALSKMVMYVLLWPLMPELDGQYPFQICGHLCQTRKTPTLAWAAKISWLGLLSKHVPFRVVAAVAPTFTTIHNTRRKCGAKFKILNFCRRKSGFLRSNFRSEMLLDNFMTLMTTYDKLHIAISRH
jgi:hypothetical protein